MKGTGTLVECARGWQVEIAIGSWTLYSGVYKHEAWAQVQAEKLATRLGLTIEWEATEAAKER